MLRAPKSDGSDRRAFFPVGHPSGIDRVVGALCAVVGYVGGLAFAMPALADETVQRLTETGAMLGTLFTDGEVDDLRFTVALDGDRPISTHVWAVIGGAHLRQRTNEGYWIPWTGRVEELIDNHFPVEDDRVVFKVVDEDIGADNQGVTISIGYRIEGVLKYGYFGLLPKGSGQ